MGGMREARIAGITDDAIVTKTPTQRATITVRSTISSGPSGTSNPRLDTIPSSSAARPMPTASPISAATKPTSAASRMTATITCRPLAPMARSSPNSRVRCATRIANVLKMMKAPTTRPIAANPSSSWVSSAKKSLNWLLRSAANSLARSTSKPGPSACTRRVCTSRFVAPGAVVTLTPSTSPGAPKTCCAVSRSNAANVTASASKRSPKLKMPTTSKLCFGPSRSTSTWSPTSKPWRRAVPASIATSPSAFGRRPADRCSGSLAAGDCDHVMPIVGAPPFWMASPSASTNCA